jgi:ketosteroid isomerase-like protein
MSPKELVERWVELFNAGDADALAALYHEDAVNHQVPESPVEGRVPSARCSPGNSPRPI